MKKTSVIFPAAALSLSLAASPVVEMGEISQDPGSGTVTVGYSLSGEPAVITFALEKDGVPVDGSATWGACGDVNCRVEPGTGKSFKWLPRTNWPNRSASEGGLKIVLKAWSTSSPPDYMAVDLDSALTNTVYYYADAASVPGGVQDRRYKTGYLLMRRIYAANVPWVRGRTASEANFTHNDAGTAKNEVGAKAVLSADYYIGVYEFTQAQWAALGGGWPSAFKGEAYPGYEMYPVSSLRKTWDESADPITPVRDRLAKINGATGLGLELPTEAQWEYACRAGSPYPYCFRVENPTAAQVGEYAWHKGNSAVNGELQPHIVGTKKPNAWGLYDMHGNVNEFCRDYWAVSTAGLTETDPFRTEEGDGSKGIGDYQIYPRVCRGGDYHLSWSQNCRSSYRYDSLVRSSEWFPGHKGSGFRVSCPAVAPRVD